MSIMDYNGSGMIVMTGKNCVAIASDMRFGVQQQTVATDIRRIYQMGDKLFMGLSGLVTDMQTVSQILKFRMKLYRLREDRDIQPAVFSAMVSNLLYEHRFGPYFVEPVIAALLPDGTPYIYSTDLIGAGCTSQDFLVAGTSTEQLYGMCESLYKKDMSPEQLFETISQALQAGVDRDCLAGWGATVHVITPEGITTRQLKSRHD